MHTDLKKTVANTPGVNVLPARGANVYDLLKHRHVALTLAAARDLEARLTRPLHRGFKPAGYDWREWLASRKAEREAQRAQRRANAAWIASVLRPPATPFPPAATSSGGVWAWIAQ